MRPLWAFPEELGDQSASPYAQEACQVASLVLWSFSGRKYGGRRTVTETYECPCRKPVQPSFTSQVGLFGVEQYLERGVVRNVLSGTGCECHGTINGRHTRLRLRGRPVRAVHEVVSGGVALSPDEYTVVNSSILQAAPGASMDVCGLTVTYTYGVNPPVAGRRAARHLAAELAMGWEGDDNCRLPERVTSVSRQGVSYTFLDEQSFLDDLKTGVYSVDLFLRAVNPDRARKPARVFSPDLPRAHRVTVDPTPALRLHDLQVVSGEPATWTVDLNEVHGGDLILDSSWAPQAQLSSSSGQILAELDESRFTTDAQGVMSVTLSGVETQLLTGTGLWDLYAVNKVDGVSIVHVLNSNVYLSTSGQMAMTM